MLRRFRHSYIRIRNTYINEKKEPFEAFFHDYNQKLIRDIKYKWKVLTEEDTEDIAQDSWFDFINGFSTIETIENDNYPYGYLRQIANNNAYDLVESRKKLKEIIELLLKQLESDEPIPTNLLSLLEVPNSKLNQLFEKLSCRCRYFLIARFRLITKQYIKELEKLKANRIKSCKKLIASLKEPLPSSDMNDEYYDVLTEKDIFDMKEDAINQTKKRCLDNLQKILLEEVLNKFR